MRFHSRTRDGLLWGGLIAFVVGFVSNHLWRDMPRPAAGLMLALALLAWAVGVFIAKRLRWSSATGVGLVWLACEVGFAGVGAVSAVLLLGAAASGLGSVWVGRGWVGRAPLSLVLGLAVILGVDGWLLPLPIHARAFYLVLLGGLVVWRRRALVELLQDASTDWRRAVESSPSCALFAVTVTGVAATCAWFPAIFFDAMSYHLTLPVQLARFGYYQMNAGTNVWALAPWASDVAHGIAWVVAGGEATGTVGLLWFVPTLAMVWALAGLLEVPVPLRWIGLALYACTPFVAGLLTTMQTELPTAAALVALALVIQQRAATPDRTLLWVVGALAALLLALKVVNVLFVGPMLIWFLAASRARIAWRFLPLVMVGSGLLAASSYVYAYVLTGNPVLPVLNEYFKSTYFPLVNFHDARWDKPLGWMPLWSLVFHTTRFAEGMNGTGPFVLIALAGSWLCALFDRRRWGLWLAGGACLVLPLTQIHYLRYAMPAMAVLVPVMLSGMPRALPPRAARIQMAALVGVCVLGLAFLPNSSWQLRGRALATLLTKGRNHLLEKYAPERLAAEFLAARDSPGDRVLLTSAGSPFVAAFGGLAYTTSWYDTELRALVARKGVISAIDYSGANLLLTRDDDARSDIASVLRRRHGLEVFHAGHVEVWRIEPALQVQAVAEGGAVAFAVPDPMAGPTWVDAEVTYRCGPVGAVGAPLTVDWHLAGASGMTTRHAPIGCDGHEATVRSRGYVADGLSRIEVDFAAMPREQAGWDLIGGHASLREDLAARRDLARRMLGSNAFARAWGRR